MTRYHRVAQRGITVAVNYWHDMAFDSRYCYHNLLTGLAPHIERLLRIDAAVGHNEGVKKVNRNSPIDAGDASSA